MLPDIPLHPCIECDRNICDKENSFCAFCHMHVVQVVRVPLHEALASSDNHEFFKTYIGLGEKIEQVVFDSRSDDHVVFSRRHVH